MRVMRVLKKRGVILAGGIIFGAVLTFLTVFLINDDSVLPGADWQQATPSVAASYDNSTFYSAAFRVARSLFAGDYTELSSWVSAESGLTFVPFSTVEPDRNLRFTPVEVKGFADSKTVYLWGVEPGTGRRIECTPAQYISENLRTFDFSSATMVGIGRVVRQGNALENVAEAFPGGHFIDFYFPPTEQGGVDWASLKVVFADEGGRLRLIALIRSVYTAQ